MLTYVQKYVTTHTNYETAHIYCHSTSIFTDRHLTLDVVNTTAQFNVCARTYTTCKHLKVIREDYRFTAWRSASTTFHVTRCMKYKNRISWAQVKSCPSYFIFKLQIVYNRQKLLTLRYTHAQSNEYNCISQLYLQ